MTRKHVAIMLCAAAVAYACAPRNRSASESNTTNQPVNVEHATDSSGLALTVSEADDARKMSFALELTNTEDKLAEVRFTSGRTHEFIVLDEQNREVWRWSAGRLFTQALQTKQLQKGEQIRYTAHWDTAAPGKYRVVASLNSKSYTLPIEKEFIVK
jgi:hypothetical protein